MHRDLKPSNVLLAADGPRVIDFGISRAREASILTQSGMIVGTPGSLSPEQARGHPVGPPSDIFSLGGVLTYAATGEGPFGSGPTDAMVYRVVEAEPDLSGVPAELRPIVERCLAKDPAARPAAAELLAELDRLGVDIGVDTPQWLPAAVADSVARYVPAGQPTPVPDPGTSDAATPDPGTSGTPEQPVIAGPTEVLARARAAAGATPAAPAGVTPAAPAGVTAAAPRGARHRRVAARPQAADPGRRRGGGPDDRHRHRGRPVRRLRQGDRQPVPLGPGVPGTRGQLKQRQPVCHAQPHAQRHAGADRLAPADAPRHRARAHTLHRAADHSAEHARGHDRTADDRR